MVDKAGSPEVFSSIFGNRTDGLSLFSNNAFRRPKATTPEVGRVELNISASIRPNYAPKEVVQIRAPEAEGKKVKKKKKLEQVSSVPLSSDNGVNRRDNPPVAAKKGSLGSGPKKDFAADKGLAKTVKGLHVSHEAAPSKKLKQQVNSKGPVEDCVVSTNAESRTKHGKRAFHDASEQQKPIKRQKTSNDDGFIAPIRSEDTSNDKSAEGGSERAKTSTKRKKDDSPDAKYAKKLRKLEESLEARYEKKLRGTDNILTMNEDTRPAPKIQEEEKSKGKRTGVTAGKRKRLEGDELVVEASAPRTFDAEEKLKRTIFVGNLPLTVKRKALIKEFSVYGPVESVRLRSVPLLDTKIPRRGAIIKGQINEAVNSQHAYVVFEKTANATAALAHNMKEFCGNHLRVDAAHAPHQTLKEKSSLQYDPKRSIFVGNVPFDVKDEELYQTFGAGKSPEMDIEAVRVVRDPHTSVSKGIAYVLFKTKAGALPFLSIKRKVKLRDRILRISRVLASQSMHKGPSPFKRVKKVEDVDNSQSQKKRAKLSASYEGIRAIKESRLSKEKPKAAGKKGGQQHSSGSLKTGSRGSASALGAKRKRVEKHQRGISRSKKIRRA